MKIRIELVGVLQGKASGKKREVEVDEAINVLTLIRELAKSHEEGTDILLDDIPSLKSNVLILVNEREISVLDGFETRLYNGDKVTIVPVSHGG